MLDKKLQIRPGQTIAIIGSPIIVDVQAQQHDPETADALLVFAVNDAQVRSHLALLGTAADDGKLTWIAYPKAKQLGTDINRDSLRALLNAEGLDPVRQVAIDAVWSALRIKRI